jgi:hypothetical protein
VSARRDARHDVAVSEFAFVSEILDEDEEYRPILTGEFVVEVSGDEGGSRSFGSLRDAIEWAQAQSSHVQVELEGARYSLDGVDGIPALPDDLVRGAVGRRRPAGQEWLDRTSADPVIAWEATIEIHPADLEDEGLARHEQERLVEAAVAALRKAGFAELAVDASGLDEGLADIQTQLDTGAETWTTSHSLSFEISATIEARTRHEVVNLAVDTVADTLQHHLQRAVWRHDTDEPMYLAWGVTADARPVGSDASPQWLV